MSTSSNGMDESGQTHDARRYARYKAEGRCWECSTVHEGRFIRCVQCRVRRADVERARRKRQREAQAPPA